MTHIRAIHTLPTHLGVRDPVLWGLDEMQLARLAAGVLLAALITRQALLPFGVRLGAAGLVLGCALACALVSIEGRSLEAWLLAVGRYAARPRTLVWASREPDHPWARAATDSLPGRRAAGCAIRHLHVTWLDGEDASDLGEQGLEAA